MEVDDSATLKRKRCVESCDLLDDRAASIHESEMMTEPLSRIKNNKKKNRIFDGHLESLKDSENIVLIVMSNSSMKFDGIDMRLKFLSFTGINRFFLFCSAASLAPKSSFYNFVYNLKICD